MVHCAKLVLTLCVLKNTKFGYNLLLVKIKQLEFGYLDGS